MDPLVASGTPRRTSFPSVSHPSRGLWVFTHMYNWSEIRRRVLVDGQSKRSICREFDIHWDTLQKILANDEPPGYRHARPRVRPKLDPFLPIIHRILQEDRKAPRKQRHTTRR